MILTTNGLQESIKQEIKKEIETMAIRPVFKIIQVGDNPASNKYIGQKLKHCEDVGIDAILIKLPESTTTYHVMQTIRREQDFTNAIIVQLPLPKHIDERRVLEAIDPSKDVDCLTTTNIGRLHAGSPYVEPCTPSGIIELLERLHGSLDGKTALVIGRSHIVGRPMSEMLTARNVTVTLAHSKTKDLNKMLVSGDYDIIISAVGKAKAFVANADTLVDVGINFDEDGKMCGDFDIWKCAYNYATPVPNGVGRMTIIGLLRNIVKVSK